MARKVDRSVELQELKDECLGASGYIVFAGILGKDSRIRWQYIKRDFYNSDILTALASFRKMAVQDMEGMIEQEEGGDSGGEEKQEA